MSNFNVAYSAGGVVDKIKNMVNLEHVDEIRNLENIQAVKNLENIETLESVKEVDNLKLVEEIGKIRGFASKSQPYNVMEMFEIPALEGEYEFYMELPDQEVEILALSLTCSGYGESDHYDLYFNGSMWFKDWYCSEVKEGLFVGTSTYVYAAPSASRIDLVFKNDSGTSKKIWLGARMLVDS